jgi:hypothetical protein
MVRGGLSPGIVSFAALSAVVLAPAAEELLFRGIIQGWLQRVFLRPTHKPALTSSDAELLAAVELPAATALDDGRNTLADEVGLPNPYGPPQAAIGAVLPATHQALDRKTTAARWAPILLTSALFAMVHLPQWPAPIALFFLSLALGFVFEWTGSLIATFVMHALFNALGALLLFHSLAVPAEAKKPAPAAPIPGTERGKTTEHVASPPAAITGCKFPPFLCGRDSAGLLNFGGRCISRKQRVYDLIGFRHSRDERDSSHGEFSFPGCAG